MTFVDVYNKTGRYSRSLTSAERAQRQKIRPPYYCPWRHSDGCKQISWSKDEHHLHIMTKHELPEMKRRRESENRKRENLRSIAHRFRRVRPLSGWMGFGVWY